MPPIVRYVCYDADTREFRGFFKSNRKDIPEPKKQYDSPTFVEDKGDHTHFNPDTNEFYTPYVNVQARMRRDERDWAIGALRDTDRFMLLDTPLNQARQTTMIAFRAALRDYIKLPPDGNRPVPAANLEAILRKIGIID